MNILVSRAFIYTPLGTEESCEADKPVKISGLILKSVRKGSCNLVVMASKAYLRRKEAKIDAKSRL